MKVKEVIAELQTRNPEALVVVHGYEGGYNDVINIHAMDIVPNAGQEHSFYGEYEEISDEEEQKNSVPAIELWGENRKAKD